MLDTDTRRRIDTARDILVGKVPDPKSQVEQITIALIYKFMDDIDAESEELGGRRSFFDGGFARYGWARLMRAGLGGHEILNLYAEAITRMPENPGIPPLFRDIFKNAYLPYRDPETLRAFLKVIDEFAYDHSERLGDAFEYLLSVLGSQGDAGQFRTPRHVIDFIVAVIDPKKDETVLDPACGTAGFLISAYKHILRANMDMRDGQDENHTDNPVHPVYPCEFQTSMLTPDERGRLAENFKGYDISPDMVRLSLVNMYLHGFADPRIFEYDTLTSEDRWNEYADVILANPPFMSPKGGIRPHNRFSVQSKRSEVLFVDYMAEHLTPSGRAGIIVPEGIIFQSQNAYKQLRRMLVEEYLVAVVSLPAGVFQPYSGVKTSILILDKPLAKRTDKIAFFKVENDGFDLGAQRREIDRNDLPDTARGVKEYMNMDAQDIQDKKESRSSCPSMLGNLIERGTALIVEKERIAANGDYNLSGERYRESEARGALKWPLVKIDELCVVERGASPRPIRDFITESLEGVNWIKIKTVRLARNSFSRQQRRSHARAPKSSRWVKPGDFILSNSMSYGRPYIMATDGCIHDGWLLLREKSSRLDKDFLYHILGSKHIFAQFERAATGGVVNNLNSSLVRNVEIPLPPLEVQKEIVAEIEGYQKVIDGARAVIDNYRPNIAVDPEWPMVELNEICANFQNGANFSKDQVGRGTRFVNIKDLFSPGVVDWTKLERVELTKLEVERKKLDPDDLLFVRSSVKEEGVGYPSLMAAADEPVVFCGFIIKCSPNRDIILPAYLLHLLRTPDFRAKVVGLSNRANITNISQDSLKALQVPLPPLETQQAIVADIEAEQALVNANRELVERMEGKIGAAIGRVWEG